MPDPRLDVLGTKAPGPIRPTTRVPALNPNTTAKQMRRYLFIVSSRNRELYCELVERFSADARVDVIMDRRRGERRQGGVLVGPERRRRDRRMRPEVDAELRARSYAIVILSDDS